MNKHCEMFSREILSELDKLWYQAIGDNSPYSLPKEKRQEIFNNICEKIAKPVHVFFMKFGQRRTYSIFGEHIVDRCNSIIYKSRSV